MSDPGCEEWRLLVQAEVDGELSTAEAAALDRHIAFCAGCTALRRRLIAVSRQVRAEVPREPAPDRLRQALTTRLAPAPPPPPGNVVAFRFRRFGRPAAFLATGALAASLLLTVARPQVDPADDIVAGHIRALQPGHLTDVLSSDRHTVKPWFDGRLNFAPPVKDLAADGFPLLGGRLDYLGGQPVAALAYGRARHIIDVFIWPRDTGAYGRSVGAPKPRNGYNTLHWQTPSMELWAVSDVSPDDLALFVRLWQAAP
jgi:anti-sigma factor RsiW